MIKNEEEILEVIFKKYHTNDYPNNNQAIYNNKVFKIAIKEAVELTRELIIKDKNQEFEKLFQESQKLAFRDGYDKALKVCEKAKENELPLYHQGYDEARLKAQKETKEKVQKLKREVLRTLETRTPTSDTLKKIEEIFAEEIQDHSRDFEDGKNGSSEPHLGNAVSGSMPEGSDTNICVCGHSKIRHNSPTGFCCGDAFNCPCERFTPKNHEELGE